MTPRSNLVAVLPYGVNDLGFPAGYPKKVRVIATVEEASGSEVAMPSRELANLVALHAPVVEALGAAPTVEASPVPLVLPLWRIKAIADAQGLTPAIESAIEAMPAPERYAVSRAWHDGNDIERNAPSTVAIGAGIGRTPEELDQWFRDAAALVV